MPAIASATAGGGAGTRLRLFTPARLDGLVGMPFPGPPSEFKLPVRSGVRVDRLFRRDGGYVVQAGARVFEADQVVVAMASYQKQRIPEFARQLAPDIGAELHSSDYRNLAQLRAGPVLIAGAGNSGSEDRPRDRERRPPDGDGRVGTSVRSRFASTGWLPG